MTNHNITERDIDVIIERYQTSSLMSSDAYPDGGVDPLWPRMQRAALNQLEEGEVTPARYAVWAITVRDNIITALEALDVENKEQVRYHLIRAANSLSAFSELQKLIDSRRD